MEAVEVFERAAEKYADCRTYSDAGRIDSDIGVMTFKTYFVRPNLFRYEFDSDFGLDTKSGMIWSDGNEFFTNYSGLLNHIQCERISDLFLEIGRAAQPASALIPMLLLPEFALPENLVNAQPYEAIAHTSIADRSCHRIKSTNADCPYAADLLIDSLGYKLRRLLLTFTNGTVAEIVFSEVSFDRDVSEDLFNLKHD